MQPLEKDSGNLSKKEIYFKKLKQTVSASMKFLFLFVTFLF